MKPRKTEEDTIQKIYGGGDIFSPMRKTIPLLIALMFFGVLVCGCISSDTKSADAQIAPTTTALDTSTVTTPEPTPVSEPKYLPGDIVYKSPTNGDPCWLILSYDPKTDEYEIAGIFKFDDNSWGYRLDEETDWEKREFMENYCPTHIAHVDLSDVKIGRS